ncbi:LysR substrate-binding domain-containing protein [Actinomycetospora lutea]|uniref:LysR family transcriptional regulator n=1 Tax=Actinomycetospora lutea TaxID=663604 RepID=UPI002366D2BA|nr:LysR substrate-binding domain-containing protein [Actinomycetospora lutea]MDD7939449.1 LysR substrate-binding domain-containing protein [Actinomycetospora lutea]
MDTRRLPYLVEFDRHGSMRVVAELMGTSTSVVSQQIAALAREAGAALVEPDGRRARLTPAGQRLAEHGRTILAAVEAAQRDLDPDAEPRGLVRVAGFASAIRRTLMPTVVAMARTHPRVALTIREYEPAEAHAMLVADRIDLALTYDYDLAPAALDPDLAATPLWSTAWGLAVPAAEVPDDAGDSLAVVTAFRDCAWIGNSRNPADEQVLRTLASMAGFALRTTHEADSLDLVEDLILAGLGVGLLPHDRPTAPGIAIVPLTAPAVRLRASAVTRRGRETWPPLALVLAQVVAQAPT